MQLQHIKAEVCPVCGCKIVISEFIFPDFESCTVFHEIQRFKSRAGEPNIFADLAEYAHVRIDNI